MRKSKNKKWLLTAVRTMSVFCLTGMISSNVSSAMTANALGVSGISMQEEILSVEDATLQNYSIEDLKATQAFILSASYEGSGRVLDANEDGRVDVFDLCFMKRNYKETGNYYELLSKFAQNSEEQYSVSSENGEIISKIVLVQATCEYDFSEFNPVSVLGNSEYYYLLQFDTYSDAENCVKALENAENIVYAQMDGYFQLPPDELEETEINSLQIESSSLSWGVSVIEADQYASYLSKNFNGQVTVAVIDTGVANHSFLNSRILKGGYDAVNHDYDPKDDHGHGTHVAGTIVDCTPGLNINILPIKVLDFKGCGSDKDVVSGIDWAIDNHVDVINLSLGPYKRVQPGGAFEYAVEKAIAAGITVVKSAGNEDDDTKYHSPANSKASIVVSAIDSSLNRSFFSNGASNYGESVDVAAPGSRIKSSTYDGEYGYKSGTSMAAPHMAAAAAMIKYQYPNYTPSQVESALTGTCKDLGESGKDIYYGYGVPKLSRLIKQSDEPSISLSQSEWSGYTGDSFTLKANVVPSGQNIVWSSSDTSVATVSNGSVTAQGVGTATILASFVYEGHTYSASCSVTVKQVSITLNETNKTVYQTDEFQLNAVTNPTGLGVTWTSSNSNVAAVSNGKVTAKNPGSAVITASITYAGHTYSAKCSVTVQKVGIEINPKNISVLLGDSKTLSYTASPTNRPVTFESSNNVIASVSGEKIITKAPGTVTIKAIMTYNGQIYNDTAAVKVEEPSVKLTYNQVKLARNETFQMMYTVKPEGQSVKWSSEDTSVCTVSSNGLITAKSTGNTMITATITYAGNSYIDKCNVIVGEPKVTLNKSSMSMYAGDTQSLIASVTSVEGNNISSETKSDILWSTSNSSVATVDSNGSVKGIAKGTATITARYVFCGVTYSAKCNVTVEGKPSISLNKSSLSIYIGDTSTLTETVIPANSSVSWSSSNTSVAMVNSNGKITAVSGGTATITASFRYNGVTYSTNCTVNVIKPSITFDVTNKSIYQGDTFTIYETVKPSGQNITWTSSNTSVATVSSGGRVTGINSGSATITGKFTYNGNTYSASCNVTVNAVTVSLSSYSGSATSNVWDEALWNNSDLGIVNRFAHEISLPTGTYSPSGATYEWSIVNGSGWISGNNAYITKAEPFTARLTVTYNGHTASKDYTFDLTWYKTTTAMNYFYTQNPITYGTNNYRYSFNVPNNTTVYITEVVLNGTPGESGSTIYGKGTYNGYTGWIIISVW